MFLNTDSTLYFHVVQAYELRGAGAVMHSHSLHAVMATMLDPKSSEFKVTHLEMIKVRYSHTSSASSSSCTSGACSNSHTSSASGSSQHRCVTQPAVGQLGLGQCWLSGHRQSHSCSNEMP